MLDLTALDPAVELGFCLCSELGEPIETKSKMGKTGYMVRDWLRSGKLRD